MHKSNGKSRQITVIMPGWMADAIERWAQQERRSLSGQIVYMIEPAVREQQRQEKGNQQHGTRLDEARSGE